jgi:CPA2 family monovalent cation:H+ antiporter-2
VLVAMIVAGKFVIWAPIVRAFRYSWATAVSVGIGLGQIGEFSFVLVQVARTAGLVGDDVYQATLVASVVTILINGIGVKISLRRLAWR